MNERGKKDENRKKQKSPLATNANSSVLVIDDRTKVGNGKGGNHLVNYLESSCVCVYSITWHARYETRLETNRRQEKESLRKKNIRVFPSHTLSSS